MKIPKLNQVKLGSEKQKANVMHPK